MEDGTIPSRKFRSFPSPGDDGTLRTRVETSKTCQQGGRQRRENRFLDGTRTGPRGTSSTGSTGEKRLRAFFSLSLSLPFPSFFSLPSNRFNLNTSWTDYPALIEKRKKKKKRERRGEGNCNHLGCRSLNESGWIRRRLETHTHTHTRESGKEPAVIAQFIESLRS